MARTGAAGWAELPGVGRGAAAARPELPPQCGRCDVNRMIELADGRVKRCPACHPNGGRADGDVAEEPERVVLDVIEVEDVDTVQAGAEVIPLAR